MAVKKINLSIAPGFIGMLTLLFIYLKLTGQIDWHWFLVLLPMFAPFIILLVALAIPLTAMVIGYLISVIVKKFRSR